MHVGKAHGQAAQAPWRIRGRLQTVALAHSRSTPAAYWSAQQMRCAATLALYAAWPAARSKPQRGLLHSNFCRHLTCYASRSPAPRLCVLGGAALRRSLPGAGAPAPPRAPRAGCGLAPGARRGRGAGCACATRTGGRGAAAASSASLRTRNCSSVSTVTRCFTCRPRPPTLSAESRTCAARRLPRHGGCQLVSLAQSKGLVVSPSARQQARSAKHAPVSCKCT